MHFLTGLSVDGELVELQRRLPTEESDLQKYVLELIGKKPCSDDLSTGRVKMTWLRNHFGTIRGDADDQTIEQHCRAYILDFFGSCIFADRSGSYAHLIFLSLLEDMSFSPSIEGFKHCPLVLVVDGTFTTGKYKHTLLMASSFDGNKNIFTVAFAIVSVENIENWEWFFECIQRLVT
ncbi:Protein MAIN-LIKE 2 [Linum perenne]